MSSSTWQSGALVSLCVVLVGCSCEWAEDSRADPPYATEGVTVYRRTCDVSAAAALDDGRFIVGDDEVSTFHVYSSRQEGAPLASIAWSRFLATAAGGKKRPEADIEAAAVLGEQVYWITSHGRSRGGKWRGDRHRLFAMTLRTTADGRIEAEPFGRPLRALLDALLADQRIRRLGLAEAVGIGVGTAPELAPKQKGLNIEGLSATADGKSLLVGFRNPLFDGRALLVPLENPAAVLADGAAVRLGEPILLPLHVRAGETTVALGIRSIDYSPRHGCYLIVAGPTPAEGPFALLTWSGSADDAPRLLAQASAAIRVPRDFRPEALVAFSDRDEVLVLSDDGSRRVAVRSPAECRKGKYQDGACEAKFLLDDERKTFRGLRLAVPRPGSRDERKAPHP